MLRTALRPQWLAVLALVLLLATGMSLLGRWQLDRARVHGAQESQRDAATASPRPIEQLLQPRAIFPKTAVGARVVATGEWDAGRRFLITGRPQDGRAGYWVLVPLRMDDGSAVGVVRGWVATPSDPAAQPAATPPGARVQVTGLLQPSEPPIERAPGQGTGLPAGQLPRVAITDLVRAWPYPLITGFVLAQQERPAVAGTSTRPSTRTSAGAVAGAVPVRVTPPVTTGLDWRNLAYAVQWWLFAGFGLFMWWRLVRDDHLARTGQAPTGAGPAPVGEDGPSPQPAAHASADADRPDPPLDPSLARGVAP